MVHLTIIRTFLAVNDVCKRQFDVQGLVPLNDEYTNVLNNDACQKNVHAE